MNRRISGKSRLHLATLEIRELFNAVNPLTGPAECSVEDSAECSAEDSDSSHLPGCHCGECQRMVDASGNVFYAIPPAPAPKNMGPDFFAEVPPYPFASTFKLHSLPNASKVIYLDFDGHTTVGTAWNDRSQPSIVTPPLNFEGTGDTFSNNELERIQRIWERVAEEFSPFGVDVTTEDPGVDALRKSGAGDTHWGKRVCIGGKWQDWLGDSAGGVAYLNSFTWSVETPCFVFAQTQSNREKAIVDAVSHEVGHTFGLNHDGTSTSGYYTGHQGANTPGWAPVMGVGYYQPVVHWSRGEYPDANNYEDDLSIISNANNGVGYRPDDAGDSIAAAKQLSVTGNAVNFAGIIERSTDVDVLKFGSGAGNITLRLNPYLPDPNVDILAELLDADGNVLIFDNPTTNNVSSMSAAINYTITTPGIYYLRVSGVGAGDLTTGYSDYGSIGQYWVSGNVVGSPSLGNLETSGVTFTEGDAPVALTSQITVADDGSLWGATVSIVGFQPEDKLTFTTEGSIAGSYEPSTGKLNLTGIGSFTQYQAALRSVRYENTLANPVDGSRTFNFQVSDVFGSFSSIIGRSLTIVSVNDQPTLDAIPDLSILEDAKIGSVNLFGIAAGGGETQSLTISATSDNPGLIPDPTVTDVGPDSMGKLSYQTTPDAFGSATITVTVRDNGGTANGGVDVFERKFVIDVNPVNDAPSFSIQGDVSLPKNAPASHFPGFATAISAGPDNESQQKWTFDVVADKPELFAVQPAISPDGTLSFTGARGAKGFVNVSVVLRDDGGTAYFGVDRSAAKTFQIALGQNRQPVLDGSQTRLISYVAGDSLNPPATLVGTFGLIGVTDADDDNVLGGVALVGVDTSHGKWLCSVDGGTNWSDLSNVAPSAARLMRDRDLVKFVPDKGFLGTAKLTFRAWDQSSGLAGDVIDLTAPGALSLTSPFSSAVATADVRVAPVINVQQEDTRTLGRKLASWAGVTIADADGVNAKRGIAVVGSGGNVDGHWEYRVGGFWKPLVGMSPGDATLLRSLDSVRFVPGPNRFGEAYLLYRAWDQWAGVAGTRVNTVVAAGGANPFSVDTDAFFFRVNPVSDRPVLDARAVATLSSVSPGDTNPAGDLVSVILGATVTDRDPGTVPGLAVTAYGKIGGAWQYQLASDGVWKNMPAVGPKIALLLGLTDRVRFVPSGSGGSSTLYFKAWDGATGIAGDRTNSYAGTSFSKAVSKAIVLVTTQPTLVNSSPELTSATATFTPILEGIKPVGDSVSFLLGNMFVDKDPGALKGIAVTGSTGAENGVWQYSPNGVVWKSVGEVSAQFALLLRDTDKVRFVPNPNYNGNATLSFRAWDRTRGTAGQSANLALAGNTGGPSAFGKREVIATVTVTPVNDRPVLKTRPIPTFRQVTPGDDNPPGDLVSFLLGSALSDVDTNSGRGIAITSIGSPKGKWQYRLDGTLTWTNLPEFTRGNLLLLRDIDRLRFVPALGFVGKVSLAYRGWDASIGNAGDVISLPKAGTSVSSATEWASLTVGMSNARPVLNVIPKLNLPPVAVGSASPAGVLVSTVLGSSMFDANDGTVPGIAVTGADNKNGVWEYSLNGIDWVRFANVQRTTAVVLTGDNQIRFVPKVGFTGAASIAYKAWDQGDQAKAGSTINTMRSLAVSLATQTAVVIVNTAPTLMIS